MHKITFLTAESDRSHITAAWVNQLPCPTSISYVVRNRHNPGGVFAGSVTTYLPDYAADIASTLRGKRLVAAMIVEPEVPHA